MKEYVKILLGTCLILYILSGFVGGEFNPFLWKEESRGVLVFASLFLGSIGYLMYKGFSKPF